VYDLAIIGGGPGGYVAAIRGAQHGLKVLLVEKDALGGTCLNRGCIPTKCFIYDTRLLETAKTSQLLTGIEALSVDLNKMVARKRRTVKTLVSGIEAIMKSHKIDVARGLGELASPGRIRVHPDDGPAKMYEARHVILATGSRPLMLPFIKVDGHLIQTTDEALDSEHFPDKIVIIGGGVIGIEMASIYLNLGSDVTIIELLPDILSTEDKEIRRSMQSLLGKRRARVHLKAKAREARIKGKDVEVSFEDHAGKMVALRANRLLVATGRAPVLDGIQADKLSLEMDGQFVKVNSRLETSLPGVYAIGDLVGGQMLAHKASAEAEVVVANILGGNREVKPNLVPRCIWGITEIGTIGLTEEEAKARGRSIRVGRFPFTNSGSAQAMGNNNGFVKIIGDAETGEIMGVHILGEHATDLIGEAVTAMTMEAAVEDLAETIKPHPTLSETMREAAMDWNGLAIHSLKK